MYAWTAGVHFMNVNVVKLKVPIQANWVGTPIFLFSQFLIVNNWKQDECTTHQVFYFFIFSSMSSWLLLTTFDGEKMSETNLYSVVLEFMKNSSRPPNLCLEIFDRCILIRTIEDNKYEIECFVGNSNRFQEPVFITVATTDIKIWSEKQADYCISVIKYLAALPEMKS